MIQYETPNGGFNVTIDHLEVTEREEWQSMVEFTGQATGFREVARIKGHVWIREGRDAADGGVEVTLPDVNLGPLDSCDPAVEEILTGLLLTLGEGHPIMVQEMIRICGE